MNDAPARFEASLRLYRQSQVIFASFELGLFKNLSLTPLDLNQLNKLTNCSVRGLKMILSALLAMNFIHKKHDKYQLISDLIPLLNPESHQYIGGQIEHEQFLSKRWKYLSSSVQNGLPAPKDTEDEDNKITQRFVSAMSDIGKRSAPLVTEKIPFADGESILDLGGGPGRYVEAFLNMNRNIRVTLFDQAESVDRAKKNLEKHPHIKQVCFISGNFFTNPIDGLFDTIFISNVIHIFGEDQIVELLKKFREHLQPAGRFLIKDMYLDDKKPEPLANTLFALHMLISTEEGGCYTFREIKDLLKESGLNVTRLYKISATSTVIEAKPGS